MRMSQKHENDPATATNRVTLQFIVAARFGISTLYCSYRYHVGIERYFADITLSWVLTVNKLSATVWWYEKIFQLIVTIIEYFFSPIFIESCAFPLSKTQYEAHSELLRETSPETVKRPSHNMLRLIKFFIDYCIRGCCADCFPYGVWSQPKQTCSTTKYAMLSW